MQSIGVYALDKQKEARETSIYKESATCQMLPEKHAYDISPNCFKITLIVLQSWFQR